MAQITSLLVAATVYSSTFYSWGAGILETKLPMQELELKMQGGIIARFCGSYIHETMKLHKFFKRHILIDLFFMY